MARFTVVVVSDPKTVIDKTDRKGEAVALCRWHPERGVLHRVEGEVRFMTLPNTLDFASERPAKRR